jgi:hypothetical protein
MLLRPGRTSTSTAGGDDIHTYMVPCCLLPINKEYVVGHCGSVRSPPAATSFFFFSRIAHLLTPKRTVKLYLTETLSRDGPSQPSDLMMSEIWIRARVVGD